MDQHDDGIAAGFDAGIRAQGTGYHGAPPRHPETPILTRELGFRIGLVSLMLLIGAFGLFEWALSQGRSLETARTLAVNVFVFGALFYLFNCRSLRYSVRELGVFSNHWLLLGVTAMALLQIFFTYSATMNMLFGSAPGYDRMGICTVQRSGDL